MVCVETVNRKNCLQFVLYGIAISHARGNSIGNTASRRKLPDHCLPKIPSDALGNATGAVGVAGKVVGGGGKLLFPGPGAMGTGCGVGGFCVGGPIGKGLSRTDEFGGGGKLGEVPPPGKIPCGRQTPPMGCPGFAGSRPGLNQSRKSAQGAVLHPVNDKQINNPINRDMVEYLPLGE